MPKSTNPVQSQELQLPFILQPKESEKVLIGDDEIGQLAISKYGKLLNCELDTVELLQNEIVNLRQTALQVAREISRASGKKLLDVYSAISSNEVDFLAEHIEQVLELRSLQEKLEKKIPTILVTAIIAHRLVPGWRFEDTANPQKIHPKLLDLLIEFAMQEQGRATQVTEQVESAEQTEENPSSSVASETEAQTLETTEGKISVSE